MLDLAGVAEIQHQHPGDPSAALLHTQLWNLQTEAGDHEEALKSAQAAYDLMLSERQAATAARRAEQPAVVSCPPAWSCSRDALGAWI
jgi:hypothetical protein